MSTVLEVKDLVKIYPSFRLKEVGFSLEEGKITGFIGRNGAGKTTTLHSLLGFLKPDGGEIRFWGEELRDHELEIKQRIGFVSAGMNFYNSKKLKTITAVTKSFYERWDDAAYRRSMELFALDEEKTPEKLSNGMKIKYLLALALSHGADLLILDEPTRGIDIGAKAEIQRLMLEMCGEGVSVIFISSELDEIIRCSNRIVVMRDRKQVGVVNGEGCTQQTLLNIIANGMQEGATA